MRPISQKMRKQIDEDPFFKKCIITGDTLNVSIEHPWIYAGRQINEMWAFVPLRRDLNINMQADVKDKCRHISLMRATDEDLAKYPKKDWKQIKKYLMSKYGNNI